MARAQRRDIIMGSIFGDGSLIVLQLATNQSNVVGGRNSLSLSLLWEGRKEDSKTTVSLGELQILAGATVAGWGSYIDCS